ncbi:cytochrome c [Pinirhizobacter sp.]|jgi:mono/diheme cytochrome c family protein|uniref:c-type cytochrome n=1 Tax=Pinirhizobacter sp. TaxID=2950432 RepID=UPI002F42B748
MMRIVRAAAMLCLLTGCERGMHQMYDQPRYRTQQPSPLFADGNSARVGPHGSVAVTGGVAADTSSGRRGVLASRPAPEPAAWDLATLQRGQQRYDIYCAPCHGATGSGDGIVVQRGFPAPPSYHTDRLRQAPDSHLFDVISNGYGVMYRYGDRISTGDRWAIVGYIRALQLSQHATRDRLRPEDITRLEASQVSPEGRR